MLTRLPLPSRGGDDDDDGGGEDSQTRKRITCKRSCPVTTRQLRVSMPNSNHQL
jgi:hypothetical protein